MPTLSQRQGGCPRSSALRNRTVGAENLASAAVTGTLIVIAKAPVPGRVKTRLCPPCTPVQAAGLAEASLRDTLAAMDALDPAVGRAIVLDGAPGRWATGLTVVAQRGDGLDERLAAAFADLGGPLLV